MLDLTMQAIQSSLTASPHGNGSLLRTSRTPRRRATSRRRCRSKTASRGAIGAGDPTQTSITHRVHHRPRQHQRQQRQRRHRDAVDDRHRPALPARDPVDEQQVPHPARLDRQDARDQPMFPVFDTAGSALTTHRIWMNAIADNIANVNTVKSMDDKAFQERFIVAQELPGHARRPGRCRRRRGAGRGRVRRRRRDRRRTTPATRSPTRTASCAGRT